MEKISLECDRAAAAIVNSAFAVHSRLGPGLLERIYEICLEYELRNAGMRVARQVSLPVIYEGKRLEAGLRLDLVVDDLVVVELKAIDSLQPVHTAQVLTYLKLSGYRLGLLINFNVERIKDGIKRIAL